MPATTPQNNNTNQTLAQVTGACAETKALCFLQSKGLQLLARNFKPPGRGGGELDLIMRDAQGTVIFVEVRHRQNNAFGGAAASVGRQKQKHLLLAAQYFLSRFDTLPPCRFDIVALQGAQIHWLPAAFDASKMA